MYLILAEPPADPAPELLERVRAHLKVDGDEEDEDILEDIRTAFEHLDGEEGWLNRALLPQTWDMALDFFPREIDLPFPPFREVVSVAYLDGDAVERTLVEGVGYRVVKRPRGRGGLIAGRDVDWPSTYREPGAVRIRFSAGYDALPRPVVSAIKLIVGDLYKFRETATATARAATAVPMSTTVENLLIPLRIGGLA